MSELRPGESAGTSYLWLTVPNPEYGIQIEPGLDSSLDDHRNSIRTFLAQADPTMGHIDA